MYVLSQFGECGTRRDENKELRKSPWSECFLDRVSKYKYGMAKLVLTKVRHKKYRIIYM